MGHGPLDVKRELDEVIPPYEPRKEGPRLRRYARLGARLLVGSILGIAAAALVFYILHKHLRDAQTAPAPKKPVFIQVLPPQK